MYLFKVWRIEFVDRICLVTATAKNDLEILKADNSHWLGENDQQPAGDKAAMWLIRVQANMS